MAIAPQTTPRGERGKKENEEEEEKENNGITLTGEMHTQTQIYKHSQSAQDISANGGQQILRGK